MSALKQNRHQARTVALQTLYQLDMQRGPGQVSIAEFAAPLIAEADLSAELADYTRRVAAGTWSAHERYDEMIKGVAANWDIARMAVVDRNILRLAIHELLEQPDVPARVVIDEAIEIGREFGDAETPQFINGVLDAIWKQHPACRVARGELT
jgi:transcription antitermination protein NusB